MARAISISICWFLCLSALGCETPGKPAVGASRAAIVAGTADTAIQYSMVVRVHTDRDCSGTLITPNHVLTAAHCVQNVGTGFVAFDARSPVTGEVIHREIRIADCHMERRTRRARPRICTSRCRTGGLST